MPVLLFNRVRRYANFPVAIVLMSALALSGCASWNATNNKGGDGDAYLRAVLPSIMRNWDISALDQQVRPEFYEITPRTKMEKLLAFSRRKLGALKTFTIKRLSWNAGVYTGTGAVLDETYEVDATFQKAKGVITFYVRKQNNVWKIRGLNIDSDALLT